MSRLSWGRAGIADSCSGSGWLDVTLWVEHSVMLTTVLLDGTRLPPQLLAFNESSDGQAGLSGVAGRGESKQGRADGGACCSPQVAYFQSALDKLNEAIKLAKVELRKGLAAPQSPERTGSEPGGLRGVLAPALAGAEPPHPYPTGPA